MKNKKVQRVLCFFLALLLCFTMTDVLAPMRADAFALELGWVTYVIISVMAAMGITATVSGGIDALKNAVEEGIDQYTEVVAVDWVGALAQAVQFRAGSGGGGPTGPYDSVNKIAIGAGAVAMIVEFVDWLTENGWIKGETNEISSQYVTFLATVNGEEIVVDTCQGVKETEITNLYTCEKLGYVIPIDLNEEITTTSKEMINFKYVNNQGSTITLSGLTKFLSGSQNTSADLSYGSSSWAKYTIEFASTITNAGYSDWISSLKGIAFTVIPDSNFQIYNLSATKK